MRFICLFLFGLMVSSPALGVTLGHHGSQALMSKNFRCVVDKFEDRMADSHAFVRIGETRLVSVIYDDPSDEYFEISAATLEMDLEAQQMGDGGERWPLGMIKAQVDYRVDFVSDMFEYRFTHVVENLDGFGAIEIDLTDCNGWEQL